MQPLQLHSLLSQIDVSLNEVNISSATTTYPYRAYIEPHLRYKADASSARNTGLKRRHRMCTAKPTFDMIGPLHVDVFNQSKYMLNGERMKVSMTRSKDSFVLMAKSDVTESFKVDMLYAKLFVKKKSYQVSSWHTNAFSNKRRQSTIQRAWSVK